MTRIALSHSRLSTYNQCPRKFQLQFIEKAFPKEDDSPHLVRGANVHKALENYIIRRRAGQAPSTIQPSSLKEVEETKPLIESLFSNFDDVLPEAQLAVNDKWEQVEWFSSDAYYRCIIDVIAKGGNKAMLGDFKTGKMRDYDGWGGQLHLTAGMVMSVFEEVEEATAAYIYVDHKKTHPVKFVNRETAALKEHFDRESEKVNADKAFKPVVNEFCKWCPATKKQCPYSRKL